MDYVTRQFINLTKHFRKELRKALTDLNSALHKQTEAIRESAQAANRETSPPPEVTVLTHIPESVEVHQKAEDAGNERNYKRAMFLVTALTLGALVVYADLVYLQYRQMIIATSAAQEAVVEARLNRSQADKAFNATVAQFRQDQRAWLGIANYKGKPTVNQPFDIEVEIRNTGKTPAWSVYVWSAAKPVPRGQFPDFKYKTMPIAQGVIEPNGSSYLRYQTTKGQVLGKPAFDLLSSGKAWEWVYGQITYCDVFGYVHSRTFCSYSDDDSGYFHQCGEYNEVDKNANVEMYMCKLNK